MSTVDAPSAAQRRIINPWTWQTVLDGAGFAIADIDRLAFSKLLVELEVTAHR